MKRVIEELELALGRLLKMWDDPELKPQVQVKVIEMRIKYIKEICLLQEDETSEETQAKINSLTRENKVLKDKLLRYEELYEAEDES